jgi:hypothetical protein
MNERREQSNQEDGITEIAKSLKKEVDREDPEDHGEILELSLQSIGLSWIAAAT